MAVSSDMDDITSGAASQRLDSSASPSLDGTPTHFKPPTAAVDVEATPDTSNRLPPQPQNLTGIRLGLVVGGVICVCFLMLLDSSVVSTAIPRITDEFHSLPDVGWYAGAYQLGCAALQPLSGKIYTHFSLKWSFLCFFAIFEVGSVLCGAAQSSIMLIVGRAIAGLGASGLLNGAITIVSASVPREKRPTFLGLTQGIAQLGLALGPLIGGAFTNKLTWRWSFYINLPIGGAVAIPLIFIHVPEQIPKKNPLAVLPVLHQHLDLLGAALFAPSIIMLLLALQYGGNQFAWHSAQVIGLFCGAGATFVVWCVWNHRKGANALIPFGMVRRRVVWASALNQAGMMTTLFGASYFLPIYFQAVKDVDALLSGVYLLPMVLPQLLFAALTGRIVAIVGYVVPIALYAATLSTIGTGLYSTFQPDTSVGKWVGYQILAGAGRGAGMQMPIAAVQAAVSPMEMPQAVSLLVFSQYLSAAVFLTVMNVIFDTGLRAEIPRLAPTANTTAIIELGATQFREVVSSAELPEVLVAYSNSIDRVFYLVAALGVVSWLAAWGMGWADVRKKGPDAHAAPQKPLMQEEK